MFVYLNDIFGSGTTFTFSILCTCLFHWWKDLDWFSLISLLFSPFSFCVKFGGSRWFLGKAGHSTAFGDGWGTSLEHCWGTHPVGSFFNQTVETQVFKCLVTSKLWNFETCAVFLGQLNKKITGGSILQHSILSFRMVAIDTLCVQHSETSMYRVQDLYENLILNSRTCDSTWMEETTYFLTLPLISKVIAPHW